MAGVRRMLLRTRPSIHEMGQELYRRLNSFISHLEKLGKQLNSAVGAYNSARRLARTPGAAAGAAFSGARCHSRCPACRTMEPIAQLARAVSPPAIDTEE